MKCNNCGKGVMYGHNVSHSKRRTRKIFKPNLHVVRISINGRSLKTKLCTKCLRVVKRAAETARTLAAVDPVPAPAPTPVATA